MTRRTQCSSELSHSTDSWRTRPGYTGGGTLEIEDALRDAWCAEHGDEPVIHEFRGTWPRSIPAAVRERREFRLTVRSMWSLHPLGSAVRLVGIA
ncbi:MAG: hypothetical protein P8125_13995 [Gemmatimonadota bacterium]